MDPELFQRMQEAALRFKSGESDVEEIMTPNGIARLERDASDPRGFTIQFVGDGAKRSVPLQEYPASASRPPGYPAPLPFLAHHHATVDTGRQSIRWHDVADVDQAASRVSEQCVGDGWTTVPQEVDSAGAPSRPLAAFDRDGVKRVLTLVQGRGGPELELVEIRARTGAS